MRKLEKLPLFKVVFIIALAVRLFQLSADMPLWISPVADEGIYVHNARNKALFGVSVLDEWNNMYISPISNYLVYLSFALFGVGFVQARLVSVAASMVTICVAYGCLRKHAGALPALLGGLLLAVNYVYVSFSKMALMEPTMIMFMALAMYFFFKGREKNIFFVLCGVCCSLAFITKNLAGFYFIVPYAVVLLGGRGRGRLRACSLILAGQLLVIGIWYFSFYLPNRDFIDLHNRIKIEERAPTSVAQVALNVATMFRNPFFTMVPCLSVAAVAGLILVVRSVVKRREVGVLEKYAVFWLAVNFIYLSIFSWRPLRYSLSLLIPMIIMAVVPVFRVHGTGKSGEGKGGVPVFYRWPGRLRFGVPLLLALSLLLSAGQLVRSWLYPRSMWPALAREIDERIPASGVISGGPAMSASMGIKNRLVWIHQLADYSKGDPFNRYGINYLVVTRPELEFYQRVFPGVLPELLKKSEVVYTMPVDDRGDALFIKLPGKTASRGGDLPR